MKHPEVPEIPDHIDELLFEIYDPVDSDGREWIRQNRLATETGRISLESSPRASRKLFARVGKRGAE